MTVQFRGDERRTAEADMTTFDDARRSRSLFLGFTDARRTLFVQIGILILGGVTAAVVTNFIRCDGLHW